MRLAINHFRNPVMDVFSNTYRGFVQQTDVKKPTLKPDNNNNGIHILLADDDTDDREFFTEVMNESIPEATVTAVNNGSELIRVISDNSRRLPDIIFLDLNMPCKNGQECLREIKKMQKLKNIPIVMYSTSSNKNDVENAYNEGANLYVRKPNTYAEMQKIAQKAASLVNAMRSAHV